MWSLRKDFLAVAMKQRNGCRLKKGKNKDTSGLHVHRMKV